MTAPDGACRESATLYRSNGEQDDEDAGEIAKQMVFLHGLIRGVGPGRHRSGGCGHAVGAAGDGIGAACG